MVEVMKIMATSFKRSHACTATLTAPTLQQATSDPCICWRLLDTPEKVWVSLFWGHCSFLLGPGAHQFLFVPSKSLFPQSCVNSGSSMVGLVVTSSERACAITRSAAPRAPVPVPVHCWPIPPQETFKHSSVSVSVGSLGCRWLELYVSRNSKGYGFQSLRGWKVGGKNILQVCNTWCKHKEGHLITKNGNGTLFSCLTYGSAP